MRKRVGFEGTTSQAEADSLRHLLETARYGKGYRFNISGTGSTDVGNNVCFSCPVRSSLSPWISTVQEVNVNGENVWGYQYRENKEYKSVDELLVINVTIDELSPLGGQYNEWNTASRDGAKYYVTDAYVDLRVTVSKKECDLKGVLHTMQKGKSRGRLGEQSSEPSASSIG
jgi:hypothetical protein